MRGYQCEIEVNPTRRPVEKHSAAISSLRTSAFLCASAVTTVYVYIYRRDAEERRDTQRRFQISH